MMAYIAATIMFAVGIYGTVFLVMHDHPWFAVLVLLFTPVLTKSAKEKDED
jgi:hypothetical protein